MTFVPEMVPLHQNWCKYDDSEVYEMSNPNDVKKTRGLYLVLFSQELESKCSLE